MAEQLFQLEKDGMGTLQKQIQEMLVRTILDGHLPIGEPLPSGRKLAEQLKVARNTVVFAYQQLVDEGFLISRERSGHYINPDILEGRINTPKTEPKVSTESTVKWNRLTVRPSAYPNKKKPDDWLSYPYPFIYGQYDKSLFPVADWRECCREAASLSSIYDWASDSIDHDSDALLEQIHSRLLPRRGIWASPDEILITVGAQNAIYLAATLLLNQDRCIGVENPGYYDASNTFKSIAGTVKPLELDDDGMMVNDALNDCDCVYVTPSHNYPTTISMTAERRQQLLEHSRQHNYIIIEDDYEPEFNYAGKPIPSLKSMDNDGRVIYVSSLSKTLAPGIRVGYMVAPKEFIKEARALRRLMLRHPASNNQFIVAQFLKRGYHDATVRRLSVALKERWETMHEALEKHLPGCALRPTFGGSAFWVKGDESIDASELAELAKQEGILIEPGSVFYHGDNVPLNYFRLGFSSIPADRIEQGVKILARLHEDLRSSAS